MPPGGASDASQRLWKDEGGVALLLLDLDNTVADRDAGFEYWMASKLPDWTAEESAGRAFLVDHDADGVRPRLEFLALVRDRFGLDTPVEALLDEYRELTLAGVPPLAPATRKRLVSIRDRGWKIGLVTNGEADVQNAKVERLELNSLIDGCVVFGSRGDTQARPADLRARCRDLRTIARRRLDDRRRRGRCARSEPGRVLERLAEPRAQMETHRRVARSGRC